MQTGNDVIHQTTRNRHRFHLLDGLRGVAAILVSAVHAPDIGQFIGLHSGFLAVDFFFCLSGFVIAFSYERRLATGLKMKTFVVARFIRLYPDYLFAMLGGMLLFAKTHYLVGQRFSDVRSFVVLSLFSFFMIPNVVGRLHPFLFPLDFPAWSMFYEIVANIGYALSIRILGIRASVPWIGWIASLAILVLGYVRGTTLTQYGWLSTRPLLIYALARVILCFSSGVILLRLYRAMPVVSVLSGLQPYLWLPVCVGVLSILFAPFVFTQAETFHLLAIGLLFPLLILLGAFAKVGRSYEGLCSFLGDISYPFYLFHVPYFHSLQGLKYEVLIHRRPSVLVETIVLIFLSYGMTRYVDAPTRKWLTARFNTKSAPAARAA